MTFDAGLKPQDLYADPARKADGYARLAPRQQLRTQTSFIPAPFS